MPFDNETARRYGDRGRATQVCRRTQDGLSRFEADPVAFMRALMDPETGELFVPYPAQARFLEEAFTVTEDGRLPVARAGVQCPQKSGMMGSSTRHPTCKCYGATTQVWRGSPRNTYALGSATAVATQWSSRGPGPG